MAETITFSELTADVADKKLGKNSLDTYFELDAANSRAFQPHFRINTTNVDVTGVESAANAAGHALALDAERGARAVRTRRSAARRRRAPILAEGDSWFSHPLVKTCIDVLQDSGYDVENVAAAGDTMANMLTRRQYVPFLRSGGVTHFLFSGGGNDVLGELRVLVNRLNFDLTDPDNPTHVAYYIKEPDFQLVLRSLRASYVQLINDVREVSPNTRLMLNGYGYARPQAHGPFLGDDFEFLYFDLTHSERHLRLASAIVRSMVDQFNTVLKNLAENTSNVSYYDLRKIVSQDDGRDWYDTELHPSRQAAKKIATVFAGDLPPAARIPDVA